ncbi:hypothetical protein BDY24DRAFT_382190 [Mrakia frigida]|uniref:uncharacterized protein n=1 Tax=Mrakia frigida TaxID=29902 RepID=UPI003FCC1416
MNNGQQQAPPPAYGIQRPINTLTRVQPRSLRIVVLCFTLCGCIWAAVWGVRDLQDLNDEGETSSMKVFDSITGIIYLVISAIELGGFLAALKNTARLVRIYAFASIGSVVLAAAGGIIQVIRHFALKAAIKSKCVGDSTGTFVSSTYWGSSTTFSYTEAEAITYCDKLFSRNTWYYIVWLFVAVFFAAMSSLFTFAYARQLANPSAFPTTGGGGGLRPSHEQGMPLQQYQSRLPEDYVPPYPGPPPNQPSPYDSDAKSPNQAASFIPVSAEDEAWNRSLAESERREWEQHEANQRQNSRRGREGGNEAEEEAWEEARRGAGTAAIGGGGGSNPFADNGGNGRRGRRDGEDEEDQGGKV